MIRLVEHKDIKQICDIYNYYVKNTAITFAEEPITRKDMENNINVFGHRFLVYEIDDVIMGFAYGGTFNKKSAYRHTVEVTIYVAQNAFNKQIGTKLYSELLELLKTQSIRSAIALISLPNEKSINLHEKFGFKKVGHLEAVGYKLGRWVDVGYWQKLL